MIRQFTYKNFFSYSEETTVSFVSPKKLNNSYRESIKGDYISTLLGVFGGNASGKTNLLKSLVFIRWYILSSYQSSKVNEQIPIDLHKGTSTKDDFFRASLEFEIEDGIYKYDLQLNSQVVESEKLSILNLETNYFNTILSRNSSGQIKSYLGKEIKAKSIEKLLVDKPLASMLSTGLVTGSTYINKIASEIHLVSSNVMRGGKVSQYDELKDFVVAAETMKLNPDYFEVLKDRMLSSDLGIEDINIRPVNLMIDGKSEEQNFPFIEHKSNDNTFELSLVKESSGTKRMFTLMSSFMNLIFNGGIAIIDEMETDLHPHLIPHMLDLFRDVDLNEGNAQIIFSCHHIEVMNQLQREQIILVEKDNNCISTAKALSSQQGVRQDENFFGHYNAGKYGAIPQPNIF